MPDVAEQQVAPLADELRAPDVAEQQVAPLADELPVPDVMERQVAPLVDEPQVLDVKERRAGLPGEPQVLDAPEPWVWVLDGPAALGGLPVAYRAEGARLGATRAAGVWACFRELGQPVAPGAGSGVPEFAARV